MHGAATNGGVTTVPLSGAVAAFAGAFGASAGLSAAALAAGAGAWLSTRVGRDLPVLYARQQHTRLTFVYGAEEELPPGPALVGTCDAILTAVPHVALTVRTADCLPVALAGGGAAAIVHAGWRGLAADVLGAAIGRFRSDFGAAASSLEAVIGVGIGRCHYGVGREVVEVLAAQATATADWHADGTVDLAAYARGRLEQLGIDPARITVLPGCTACSPGFHSHRRDGSLAGRQWSAVVLTANDTGDRR